ncbi:MAG: SpoIIE family protein phosphatase [Candidatus Riflebacteria bacterium]|nr:SpoIIE family protein phosphatase [Candidatus Riflebacteria bacterium]
MSLQRRLARGIFTVLAVILIFMGLTSMSYWDIEGFVTKILPVNITIARSYERLAGRWTQLGEIVTESLKTGPTDSDTDNSAKTLEIEQIISKIEALIVDPQRSESIKSIKLLFANFNRQLASFDLLTRSRNRLLRKNADRRSKAAEGLRSDVVSLLDRFKSMMVDLNTTLKNPDFQASLGNTSSLMDKISRIEKDLILAETEVALYLSLRKEKEPSKKPAKSSASRVESRLRAIIFLLENSVKESSTTLHRRVLTQVEGKVKGFFESFIKLRNILEAPESDLLETEDQIHRLQASLTELKQQGVASAAAEAEFFWNRIFLISDELMGHASRNYRLILAFLAIVLLAGLYMSIVFPRAVGGPLKKLSNEISNFRLGNEALQVPASDIEEIDTLGKTFQLMAERLNLQAEVNRNYLESIHSLTQVYRELHETETRVDSPTERLEKAVGLVLQQLIAQCPKIDLVKTMVVQTDPDTNKQYFTRLGDPEFSDNFKQSNEFMAYCSSVGYNHEDPLQSTEERIPLELGLTGWYFDNSSGIKTGVDDASFFQPVYSPPPISQNPILASRDFEKGLCGSLVTEFLNVPGKNEDEKQNVRGLLFVYFLDPAIKLSWQEIFFIQIIASQIASIIETDSLLQEYDQKKLIDDQLNMAREIQENLLPQTIPVISGMKINHINKPAAEVGGDYFDFFDLGKNRLGVVIADASGKNVPAAIIMTVFKTTLSTMELENLSAGEVLTRANRIIAKNITNDRFITAMYVIIDSVTGSVELASAGHNPAFVSSGRGHDLVLREKTVKCLPLGILEDYEYQTITFSLSAGDLLLLYTDGVTEARDTDENEFGESRLKRFLARPRGKNPADDLLKEIQEFSRLAVQHDDITAVTVEYNGSAG